MLRWDKAAGGRKWKIKCAAFPDQTENSEIRQVHSLPGVSAMMRVLKVKDFLFVFILQSSPGNIELQTVHPTGIFPYRSFQSFENCRLSTGKSPDRDVLGSERFTGVGLGLRFLNCQKYLKLLIGSNI